MIRTLLLTGATLSLSACAAQTFPSAAQAVSEDFVYQHPEKVTKLDPVWARVADFKGEYGSVESAEFSPDGTMIVAATKFDFQVVAFKVSDGAELWRISARDEVEHAQFSPDGRYVATGGEDASTRVYDAFTGEELAVHLNDQSVDSIAWSPDGTMLYSGEEDYRIDGVKYGYGQVLSWPGLNVIATISNEFSHNGVAWHPSGDILITTDDTGLQLWDARNDFAFIRRLDAVITGTQDKARPIAVNYSPDGSHLIAGGQNGHVFLFDVADDYRLVRHMAQTGVKIETIDFSPDGNYIAHAGHTPDIWLWKTEDLLNEAIRTSELIPAHRSISVWNAEDLNFSPNSTFMVSAHQDGLVRLWSLINDDPNVATAANAVLMANQADVDWGARNRAEKAAATLTR